MYGAEVTRSKLTVPALKGRKGGTRLACLTAYDYGFARVVDAAETDVILVGDSLGMVVQGRRSTLAVSVEDIAYHTRAVAPAATGALLMVDLPFLSYATVERALQAAELLMGRAGAEMLKLEGAGNVLDAIAALSSRDVPVCAHLGLTPQSVHRLGGYKVQGREERAASQLFDDARRVVDAGADALVLECVPSDLAERITAAVPIPTIGIGAGPRCDGQVLVLHDALGVTGGRRPRFVRNFMAGADSVQGAIAAFVQAVRDGSFPGPEHQY